MARKRPGRMMHSFPGLFPRRRCPPHSRRTYCRFCCCCCCCFVLSLLYFSLRLGDDACCQRTPSFRRICMFLAIYGNFLVNEWWCIAIRPKHRCPKFYEGKIEKISALKNSGNLKVKVSWVKLAFFSVNLEYLHRDIYRNIYIYIDTYRVIQIFYISIPRMIDIHL